MKKYTKTQLKKDQTEVIINTLIENFNVSLEDSEGGRFDIDVNGFQGQFSRRDFDVMLFDSIKLHGGGFDEKTIKRHEEAVALEAKINKELSLLMDSEAMFAHEEAYINYMNK